MVNVLRGDSADGDTAVLGHVDAMLFDHGLALLHGQAGEGEHADLSGDVGPVAWDFLDLDGSAESLSHVLHSSADNDELVEPLLAHGGVVEDGGGNSSAMLGRGRVVGSDGDFYLGHDAGGGGLVGADEMESTSTLTVETHDLSEGLGNDHLEALAEEEAETVSVLVEVARGETLVGGVEEGVELVALANIGD